ncbi:PetM family cytochrome b6-f complex subunit 7 [Acaryochloris sp. 'Moss Beach']|nr:MULTISPECIES: PetM family cytochrome b6-f complex subunit 7 [Acaryochloris]QUY42227.1 PetM family cytochrome b6-f complex subunit 7 [Acaryochloris marina S15]UJB71337.1 PetM family cytochrome b6-f complex subunit 7 [Acaryochloris sp. 'Moss Beach']
MGGEIFTTAFLCFSLILVGIGLGYLLLKVAPD